MTVRLVNNGITSSLRRIQSQLDRLPQEAYNQFVKSTPKKTGNARRSTKLKGNEIQANYAYAQPLDDGWSKQAPDGMTKPTEQYIKKRVDQIIRK
jgi:hypothetical protein